MNKSGKWVLFAVALVIMAINYLSKDFSAYLQMSAADLAPVIVITAVIFLVKTGVLSAVLIGFKKLWERLKNQ